MAINIVAMDLVATKLADGTVKLQVFIPGLSGSLAYEMVLPSADVTSINTNVNGGATAATRTFHYTQDQNASDYDLAYSSMA
jgi:hypothetical protein